MIADTRAPWTFDPRIDLAGGGIDHAQANRQMRTAQAILKRLADEPGVVLADEVGMGKTFVALAVAVSAAVAARRPVVVMVPPRLVDKWERDIKRFRDRCMSGRPGEPETERLRFRRAETGAEFLRCFDDPEGREAHVVLLVNTALHRSERDPFVRLEAIRQAVQGLWGARHLRHAVARFARKLLRSGSLPNLIEKEIEALFDRPCETWLEYMQGIAKKDDSFHLKFYDDPVPAPFVKALKNADLGELTECLRKIPRRESKNIEERLTDARKKLNSVLHGLWRSVLKHSRISSPLLVFDEAHHLKNPDTRLSSLFQDPNSGDTSVFCGAFDRMMFLTATPFQLGHCELLEVLKRFLAVRWASMPPERKYPVIEAELSALGAALDRAQGEALHLERLWGELSQADVPPANPATDTRTWWTRLLGEPAERGILARIAAHYGRTLEAFNAAQKLLRPWVLRHLRPRQFVYGGRTVARRREYTGRAIVDGISHHRGLEIETCSRFPYLLCARAQSLLARVSRRRAYFAEGLASSFGAFLETSRGERPVDDPHVRLRRSSVRS